MELIDDRIRKIENQTMDFLKRNMVIDTMILHKSRATIVHQIRKLIIIMITFNCGSSFLECICLYLSHCGFEVKLKFLGTYLFLEL